MACSLRPRTAALAFALAALFLLVVTQHESATLPYVRQHQTDAISSLDTVSEFEPSINPAFPGLSRELIFALGRQAASHAKAWPAQAAACPPQVHDVLVSQDMIRDNREFWESFSGRDVLDTRETLARHLNSLREPDLVRGRGRGIVLTAGNKARTHPYHMCGLLLRLLCFL
jgi:hypothetical protein